ncbi:MAG: hypothetical protein SGI90_09540 [Candidatus Eisenbacteria bacterium]|nr:hypothetical protein [Candidatus Eisenbacteria bacterium]
MKKRQLLYVPEINPRTFLLFYDKGTSGRSYSFRDYVTAAGVIRTEARQYRYSTSDILGMARWSIDAPAEPTENLGFWRREILALNAKYLGSDAGGESVSPVLRNGPGPVRRIQIQKAEPPSERPAFPLLSPRQLFSHPVKGAKQQDIDRIVSSAA